MKIQVIKFLSYKQLDHPTLLLYFLPPVQNDLQPQENSKERNKKEALLESVRTDPTTWDASGKRPAPGERSPVPGCCAPGNFIGLEDRAGWALLKA